MMRTWRLIQMWMQTPCKWMNCGKRPGEMMEIADNNQLVLIKEPRNQSPAHTLQQVVRIWWLVFPHISYQEETRRWAGGDWVVDWFLAHNHHWQLIVIINTVYIYTQMCVGHFETSSSRFLEILGERRKAAKLAHQHLICVPGKDNKLRKQAKRKFIPKFIMMMRWTHEITSPYFSLFFAT